MNSELDQHKPVENKPMSVSPGDKKDTKLRTYLKKLGYGLRIGWKIFNEKSVLAHASVCGYATILSLVPILAISLSILNAFTSSEPVTINGSDTVYEETFSNRVIDFVFEHFLPGVSEESRDEIVVAKREIMGFVEKAASMRFVILVVLIIASVSLFNSIEHAFNEIWSVRHRRSLFARFLAFWIIITLTPLLLALSYYYTTQFVTSTAASQFMNNKVWSWLLWQGMSYFLTLMAFLIANRFLPNQHVNFMPALIASASSAILWEAAKISFDLYINYVLSTEGYYTIFGSLAAIPLFIVWLYYSFLCFLLGPVIATTIQDFDRHMIGLSRKGIRTYHRPVDALLVFLDICRHFVYRNDGISFSALLEIANIPPKKMMRCLKDLEQARLIHQDKKGTLFFPNVNPDQTALTEVLERLIGARRFTSSGEVRPTGPIEQSIQSVLASSNHVPMIGNLLQFEQ